MSEQAWVAIGTALGATAAAFLGWVKDRRKGAAEATKTGAEARALASADNREWAAVFLSRLTATEGKLDATEAELEAERQAHAATRDRLAAAERKIADLQRELAEVVREVRRLGGHVPGDTPAHGGAAIAPPLDPEGGSA